MYCRESEVLDSRNWRRLVTVLKKDSCTVGEADWEVEALVVLFLGVEGVWDVGSVVEFVFVTDLVVG